MKKLVILSFLFFGYVTTAQEISDNAIGLRIGGNNGFGTEISYQRALGNTNRLELDLGWKDSDEYDAYKLTGLYQWVWNIDGGFNWFAGAGGGLGTWNSNQNETNDGFYGFFAGDIGIEYNFDFPLLVSLDFRPEIGFEKGFNNDLDFDLALGVRYQF
ncbi:hypothetical protein IMCC3317_03020 [Kordia antarctica]|uniref:Outer membrane protein beta-barrel domain-containing protein n=1 Tax=Kordia antarctica TaxID=1218801 RepID=A0A7L4ZFH9_9FLAO|nr:hypothetical protein [Kordia antarctica]QHI34956.1 hypothetical protein IMCC3317_03020 [Kordia antarctica]